MMLVLILMVAFCAAMLTFISGFGLGTILMPAFALFFPVEIAIAMTAVVHLANNLFKAALIGRAINYPVFLYFGIPAILTAFAGATLLKSMAGQPVLYSYEWGGHLRQITLLNLLIALLLVLFAVWELTGKLKKIRISHSLLPLGGMVSGFFGGLSGHQGALRSLFLLRAGLEKEGYIATGIAVAIVVDLTRLTVYGSFFLGPKLEQLKIGFEGSSMDPVLLLILAMAAAFLGSFLGKKVLKKITYGAVQVTVGILIILLAVLLGAGLV